MPTFAGKIAFVDAERAVMQVEEGRVKLKELEDWAVPRREQLQAMADRVQELQDQISRQRMVATADVLEQLSAEERNARRRFEDAKRDFDRELDSRQDEFLAEVAVKVGTVASDYGKANGYDAIFVLKAQPLIYISEEANLTDLVIRLYNERFPVSN
jgi:outer membrane protein